MTQTAAPDLLADLRTPLYRGPMQYLRSWSDLDALHDRAAAEIEQLRAENRRLQGITDPSAPCALTMNDLPSPCARCGATRDDAGGCLHAE